MRIVFLYLVIIVVTASCSHLRTNVKNNTDTKNIYSSFYKIKIQTLDGKKINDSILEVMIKNEAEDWLSKKGFSNTTEAQSSYLEVVFVPHQREVLVNPYDEHYDDSRLALALCNMSEFLNNIKERQCYSRNVAVAPQNKYVLINEKSIFINIYNVEKSGKKKP